jgi:patatin-like phospholipase/acyl hydrolase
VSDSADNKPFRVLTLDGGGAKGFYTLGVLHEVEAMLGKPLYEAFDLIFGTSTGAIIGTLLAIGTPVIKIHELYRQHVPSVMRPKDKERRSAALKKLGDEILRTRNLTL